MAGLLKQRWMLGDSNIAMNDVPKQYRSASNLLFPVDGAQQRTAFSNDPTGVLYWVRHKVRTELYTGRRS
jgi:hypothetical protein